jgi:hypothetical protein
MLGTGHIGSSVPSVSYVNYYSVISRASNAARSNALKYRVNKANNVVRLERLHLNLKPFQRAPHNPPRPKEGAIISDRLRTPSWIQSCYENSCNDFEDNFMRARWANRFPRWPPHSIDGRIHELSHLHPFRYPLLLPEKLNWESREVEIRVAFSAHTFTRGCSIAEDPDYHYSTAPRDLSSTGYFSMFAGLRNPTQCCCLFRAPTPATPGSPLAADEGKRSDSGCW